MTRLQETEFFSRTWFLFCGAIILGSFFTLALTSLTQKSPTFDEHGFLTRGVGYVTGTNQHMRVGHPAGLNILNGFLVAHDPTLKLPTDDPSWQRTQFHRPSELFLWEIGNDVNRLMLLGRLPTVWLGMLLISIAGKWATQLSQKRQAGLLAMLLLAFDPNILAHARLVTTDLGLALGVLIASYTLWRFLQQPSWGRVIMAGIGFAILQNTKFTAGLFVPLLALVIVAYILLHWRQTKQFPTKMIIQLIVGYPLSGFFALWAMYGFDIGTLPASLPTLPQLASKTLPLAHHLEQLLDIGGRLQKETPAFLWGDYRGTGWWYYFPIAFLLKTPLPTLILLAWATVQAIRQRQWQMAWVALLLPAIGYFAFALTTDINLGYRHLLPILPLLAVFMATVLSKTSRPYTIGLPILLTGLIIPTLWLHPHYLASFNLLAGGPDNGWHYLVDSNIDWGQDLPALAQWQAENGVDTIWLSYFGESRPDYYGIDYQGLPSFPDRLMNPYARTYYPPNPAPGIYAISVSNLQGVLFEDHDLFAYFRDKEPIAKIGYSIFMYEVPATNPPFALVLDNLQIDEIPFDERYMDTNDIYLHWIDSSQALLFPRFPAILLAQRNEDGNIKFITNFPHSYPDVRFQPPTYQLLILNNSTIRFQSSSIDFDKDNHTFSLQTDWRQMANPAPVKIFVHVVNEEGEIVAQWDGLGIVSDGWHSGEELRHWHDVKLSTSLPPGNYSIYTGLYHPDTGDRYQTENGDDRILIGTTTIP